MESNLYYKCPSQRHPQMACFNRKSFHHWGSHVFLFSVWQCALKFRVGRGWVSMQHWSVSSAIKWHKSVRIPLISITKSSTDKSYMIKLWPVVRVTGLKWKAEPHPQWSFSSEAVRAGMIFSKQNRQKLFSWSISVLLILHRQLGPACRSAVQL